MYTEQFEEAWVQGERFFTKVQVEEGDYTEVRINQAAKEEGYEVQEGPLDWVNSVGVMIRPDRDEITFSVSAGDPRGAWVLRVWRGYDGRIRILSPSEEDNGTMAQHACELVQVGQSLAKTTQAF